MADIECVNDVTNSRNYVLQFILKVLIFVKQSVIMNIWRERGIIPEQ